MADSEKTRRTIVSDKLFSTPRFRGRASLSSRLTHPSRLSAVSRDFLPRVVTEHVLSTISGQLLMWEPLQLA